MNTPSPTVGLALANAVADRLESGHILADKHPEYCGVGLQCTNGVFICAEVYDGDVASESQYLRNKERGDEMEFQSFPSRAEFVAWLAAQTDQSLSGAHLSRAWLHNNQRLSLARLEKFIS